MIMELHRENWKEAYRYWQDDEFIGWLICNKTIVLHRGSLPQEVELAAARRRARTIPMALPSGNLRTIVLLAPFRETTVPRTRSSLRR